MRRPPASDPVPYRRGCAALVRAGCLATRPILRVGGLARERALEAAAPGSSP
ncbi:hypothetical protein SLNWT_3739 [Streptomyces albus]|uniref:Uncharacterized protein n=1 Tax=Streptomyces albus (strain ATCC 21838 / DSM 41398 / FERM P-419 / JCM 4703 / NBRC 107858) TaxID=1081613 RepID=A0A0B5EY05_STRA4|nr:hypothetical protein SLNWT_3739 [Streptomyces albus]